jgi:hypothetical protein
MRQKLTTGDKIHRRTRRKAQTAAQLFKKLDEFSRGYLLGMLTNYHELYTKHK